MKRLVTAFKANPNHLHDLFFKLQLYGGLNYKKGKIMKGKMLTVFTLMTVFVVGFSYAVGPVAKSEGNLSQMANKANTQVRYRLTYQEMDKNTDGQVTKEEYQAAIKQRREKSPGLGANQNANMFTFEELDLNGDGKLSQEEFNQHLAATSSRRLKHKKQ